MGRNRGSNERDSPEITKMRYKKTWEKLVWRELQRSNGKKASKRHSGYNVTVENK